MAVKISDPSEVQKYSKQLRSWSDYLLNQVKPGSFVSASSVYVPYSPHWISDSSFISIELLDYSLFLKNNGENYDEVKDAAHSINAFHCAVTGIEKLHRRTENIPCKCRGSQQPSVVVGYHDKDALRELVKR